MESRSGDWNLGIENLGLGLDWVFGPGIGIRIGDWDWRSGLGTEVVDWNYGFGD